jgi:putative transposase
MHVVNRGNDRRTLFSAAPEYDEFVELMRHAAGRRPLRILAYVLMPNHWHMVVWPQQATQLSQYLQLLGTAHSARWRHRRRTTGEGHVYQGRYHAFLVESERQYFNVLRYVEANPVRAGLVTDALDWRWSSLAERATARPELIVPGPLPLPSGWSSLVQEEVPPDDLADIRRRLQRIHRAAWQPSRRARPTRQST